jgi:NADH-quinone oxidoreductase subunit M
MPAWVDALQVRIYLLLMNRLYLDALSMRLRPLFAQGIESLNGRPAFSYVAGAVAVVLAVFAAVELPVLSLEQIVLSIIVALALPLFPFHGIYIAALTRSSGYLPLLLTVLLPAAGLYGLVNLRDLPIEILRAVNVLALVGALYGSIKALGQVRVPHLLAYSSLAFYSALWWHFAAAGRLVFPALVYVAAEALLTAGLLLAWQRLRRRYGNLTLDRMHGLARPMPRFASLFSLLVMAGVGLPPFALFFRPIEMLLQPSLTISSGLWIILLMWFLTSWYLFRMMQRLLFGQHRTDMRYEDLRSGEVIYFGAILLILAVLGTTPPALLKSGLMINGHRTAMEMMLWPR